MGKGLCGLLWWEVQLRGVFVAITDKGNRDNDPGFHELRFYHNTQFRDLESCLPVTRCRSRYIVTIFESTITAGAGGGATKITETCIPLHNLGNLGSAVRCS